jgi:hypothetical protein
MNTIKEKLSSLCESTVYNYEWTVESSNLLVFFLLWWSKRKHASKQHIKIIEEIEQNFLWNWTNSSWETLFESTMNPLKIYSVFLISFSFFSMCWVWREMTNIFLVWVVVGLRKENRTRFFFWEIMGFLFFFCLVYFFFRIPLGYFEFEFPLTNILLLFIGKVFLSLSSNLSIPEQLGFISIFYFLTLCFGPFVLFFLILILIF